MEKFDLNLIEHDKRITQVMSWIVQDVHEDLMVRQILQFGWCQEEKAREYIEEARERWTRDQSFDIEKERQLMIVKLQERKRSLKDEFKGTPAGMKTLNDLDKMICDLKGISNSKLPNPPPSNLNDLSPEEIADFLIH